MKIGNLTVNLHRTVRVPEGSTTPAALPPSLGTAKTYDVAKYRDRVPASWEDGGVFIALWDVEALWLSFSPTSAVALIVGAGNVNAVTGQKLTAELEDGNYLVAPPQPWLDGWKGADGAVYQFVSTPYQKGEGKTVGEQILGKKSVTGGIGIAVFDPKVPFPMYPKTMRGGLGLEGAGFAVDGGNWGQPFYGAVASAAAAPVQSYSTNNYSSTTLRSASSKSFSEMGVGKGGLITQKIYPDPHGLDKWKDTPEATAAIYLVDAELAQEVLGETIPKPTGHEQYKGWWYGMHDNHLKDVDHAPVFQKLDTVQAQAKVGGASVFKK